MANSCGRQANLQNHIAMKKLIMLLMLLPVFAAANAQFHVGAEAGRILNDKDPYWQVGATGSYTRHLYENLSFDADVTLFYQNVEEWGEPFSQYGHTFGVGLGVNAIIHVGGPMSIFTGPKAQCNLIQIDYSMHRANVQWRVGLQADFWRLRLRASWDILCTNRDSDYPKGSLLTVGVAWKL